MCWALQCARTTKKRCAKIAPRISTKVFRPRAPDLVGGCLPFSCMNLHGLYCVNIGCPAGALKEGSRTTGSLRTNPGALPWARIAVGASIARMFATPASLQQASADSSLAGFVLPRESVQE